MVAPLLFGADVSVVISFWSEEEAVKIGNDSNEIACYRSNGHISAVRGKRKDVTNFDCLCVGRLESPDEHKQKALSSDDRDDGGAVASLLRSTGIGALLC